MAAPSDNELHALLQTIIPQLMKLLTRWGVLIDELGRTTARAGTSGCWCGEGFPEN